MDAVRNLPQGSAIDIPWHWILEKNGLTESSVIYPTFELQNEKKIVQTIARLFFAINLPVLAKPFGFANLGLGGIHLVWCICNIGKIKTGESGYSSKDIENALTRICTGIYDLAIGYLLCSTFMSSIWGRPTIPLAFALLPAYPIQLHKLIFEKATKEIPKSEKETEVVIDHYNLKVGCLIKQFCSGLVETFAPKPEATAGLIARATTLPNALITFGANAYTTLRGTHQTK